MLKYLKEESLSRLETEHISGSSVPYTMTAAWSMLKNFLMNATHLNGKGLSPMQ